MTLYVTPFGHKMLRRMGRMVEPELYERMHEVVFPVDVKAENDDYVIYAVLPGLTPDEVEVQVVKNAIQLKGEFKHEQAEGEQYLLRERPVGRFSRVISLPEEVDASKAEASMENGVLVLRLPKAEQARARTIKINVN